MATAGDIESAGEAGATPRRGFRLPHALPHLEGRRGTIVRAIYFLLAIVTLIVIAGSFWFNGRDFLGNMPTAAAYGFRTQTGPGGPTIAGVSGAQARASGLRQGDRFLSIDGEPLPASATEFDIGERLAADADGRVTIVARSRDGAVRVHRLTRTAVTAQTIEPTTRMPLWLFIGLGFAATQLPLAMWFAASLLLALRRPRDPEAMLFAFALLLFNFNRGAAFWLYAIAGVSGELLETITSVGGALMMAAMAGFPDGRFRSIVARCVFAIAALLALLILWPTDYGLAGPLFLLCNLGVLVSLWLRYRRETPGVERQQIKWAVLGFASALALLLPVQISGLLGLLEGEGALPYLLDTVLPPLALMLVPVGLLVSLLRYRLYDADQVISRSAGYALLTLLLGATFAGTAKGMEYFFETSFGRDAGALPGAIGAGLAVVLITPMHNRIHRWAERRFQKALLHLRRDLPLCAGDLRETAGLEQLLGTVLARIGTGVRATRSAVVLREETGPRVAAIRDIDKAGTDEWRTGWTPSPNQEGLDCDPRDPLFPMRIALTVDSGAAPETIGWILLGPRPDGSFYGKDEQEALAEIADPVARAVQIVKVREERQKQQDRRFAALEAAVAKLANGRQNRKGEPLTGSA
jgi:hypothetical protein